MLNDRENNVCDDNKIRKIISRDNYDSVDFFLFISIGMDWVLNNHEAPAVVSMSLGGGFSSTENILVQTMFEAGIIVSVAAGNDNADACNSSPASAPYVSNSTFPK